VVERCHEELSIVNLTITIGVDSLDDFLNFSLVEIDSLDLFEGNLKFLRRQSAAAVLVKLFELLSEVIKLLLRKHILHKESEHGLLYFRVSSEFFEVVKCR
jgi:hypothetical protein